MKLDAHKERVTTMNKLHRELSNEKEMIANELGNVNRMHEDVGASSSSSSSSVLSSSVGSKRERASYSPSSSSSSSSRTAKRQKKEGTPMAEHAGQWLYEEGMAYWDGLNFKIKDQNRGQLMIEASASSGFPLAVADCHYLGWNGTEKDFNCQVNKKPMDWVQFVTIMVVALLETTSRLVNGTPNQVHRKTVLHQPCPELFGWLLCQWTGVCSKQNQSGRIV